MNPTLPMAEYASRRFRLVCAMATMLPNTIDNTASGASISCQVLPTLPMPCASRRNAKANEAILGTVDRNSVTPVGAPEYTSGTHMWNGTAPNLNAIATTMNTRPRIIPRLGSPTALSARSSRFSVPLSPYTSDMPYSRIPEAMAPSTKYFIADSAARPDSRSKATMAYNDSDMSSTPMYTVSRLLADTMTKMPSRLVSAST